MKEWLRVSLILCLFGFLKDVRPSEPFVTEFLLGPWRNITEDQLNREVYPITTYSYLAQLILVFLITDFLRYKPLIIVIGLSGVCVWSMLLWSTSLQALQILEFLYGTFMAADVAYYTYMYAKVDKQYYPKVTSYTRAATFAGKLVAGISSQILVYFDAMDYRELNYLTLTAQICATLCAFLLPNVKSSLYFHREPYSKNLVVHSDINGNNKNKILKAFHLLWSHFRSAYTNLKVIQWSFWYAIGLCGHLQVSSYIQVLWKNIDNHPEVAWNGAVDAILTLLGTIFALIAGYAHAGCVGPKIGLLALAVLSILEGLSLFLSAWTTNLYISYIGYICFGSLYAFGITGVSSEVARHLEEDSYGLVFGINTLVALIFQTILTIAIVTEGGFALKVIDQFTVYGYYYIIVGIMYLLTIIVEVFWNKIKSKKNFRQV